ncbi:MAG: hypothetical protein ACLPXB_14065 [Thiobacillaceae bacterium]
MEDLVQGKGCPYTCHFAFGFVRCALIPLVRLRPTPSARLGFALTALIHATEPIFSSVHIPTFPDVIERFMGTTPRAKTVTRSAPYELRLPADELSLVKVYAQSEGKLVPTFRRDVPLSCPRIQIAALWKACAAGELNPAILELRRIHVMKCGLYPTNELGWSNEEQRRYWNAIRILLQKADAIEKNWGHYCTGRRCRCPGAYRK